MTFSKTFKSKWSIWDESKENVIGPFQKCSHSESHVSHYVSILLISDIKPIYIKSEYDGEGFLRNLKDEKRRKDGLRGGDWVGEDDKF